MSDNNNRISVSNKGAILVEAEYFHCALTQIDNSINELRRLNKVKGDATIETMIFDLGVIRGNLQSLFNEKVVAYKEYGDLEKDLLRICGI